MSKMNAAISNDLTGLLEIVEINIPRPEDGEALIKVIGSGVCHSDLHVLKNDVKFPRPAVLGHEVMGQVLELVDLNRSHPEISAGDLVVASFIMPCNKCVNCASGQSNICKVFFAENRLSGNMLDGTKRLSYVNGVEIASYSMAGFSEYSVVPLSALAVIRSDRTGPEWCVLGCAGMTAYSSVNRALRSRRKSGLTSNSAAIIGLGGVGSFMTLFCKILGVKEIVAIDIETEKLQLASELGANTTLNAKGKDSSQIKQELKIDGVDLVFEVVGSSKTIELAMDILNEGGLTTAVGIAPHGTRAAIEITPLVRREFNLKGSFGGTVKEDLKAVIKLADEGEIPLDKLVTNRYELQEINKAFESLENRSTIGRSIIEFKN